MSGKNTIGGRIQQLINEFADGTNTTFAATIGTSEANVRNYINGRLPKSDTLAKIVTCYDVSAEWLLTGRGTMLKNRSMAIDLAPVPAPTGQGVPYYNVDFCGGFDIMFNDQTRHPDGWVNFQPFSKADSWANITGHSMEPLISHGDMIAIKKVEDWRNYMLYGEIYGIVTEEYRTVKRVRKSPNPDTIILEPVNKDYDTQELELKKILSVWAVIGCAKLIF